VGVDDKEHNQHIPMRMSRSLAHPRERHRGTGPLVIPFQKPGLDGLALAFENLSRAKAVVGPSLRPGLARPNWARLGSAHGLKPGQEQPYVPASQTRVRFRPAFSGI